MPEPPADCVLVTVNGKCAFTEDHYECIAPYLDKNSKYCYRIRELVDPSGESSKTHHHSQEWLHKPMKPSHMCNKIKTLLSKKFPEDYPADNPFKSWVQVKPAYSYMEEYFTKDAETTVIMKKNLPEIDWIDQFFKKFQKAEKAEPQKKLAYMEKLKKMWDADKGPADSKSKDAIRKWMNCKFNDLAIPYPKDGRTAMWLIHKFYCYLNRSDYVTDHMAERWEMTCN